MSNTLLAYRATRRRAADKAGEPIRFVAASEGIKRDGLELVISRDSVVLESFKANPVVLIGHDYVGKRLPIGTADVWIEARRLMADVSFDMEDPLAVEVDRKMRAGVMNAVSIGWATLERDGSRITKWELLDVSVVPVPADSKALAVRMMRGRQQKTSELKALAGDLKRYHDLANDRTQPKARRQLAEINERFVLQDLRRLLL